MILLCNLLLWLRKCPETPDGIAPLMFATNFGHKRYDFSLGCHATTMEVCCRIDDDIDHSRETAAAFSALRHGVVHHTGRYQAPSIDFQEARNDLFDLSARNEIATADDHCTSQNSKLDLPGSLITTEPHIKLFYRLGEDVAHCSLAATFGRIEGRPGSVTRERHSDCRGYLTRQCPDDQAFDDQTLKRMSWISAPGIFFKGERHQYLLK